MHSFCACLAQGLAAVGIPHREAMHPPSTPLPRHHHPLQPRLRIVAARAGVEDGDAKTAATIAALASADQTLSSLRFKSASLKLIRPSTLLLSTQTEREAMGHLSKYYPIRSRSSGVSNQRRTRHHDTPLARGNKPVQQRNADDGFWLLKRRLPQTRAQQASKKQLRELPTSS